MALLDDVKEIVVEQLPHTDGEIKEDSNLIEDLGADSLDCIEIVMAIEDKWMIDVSDEDWEDMKTVGQIVKYLEKEI